MNDDQMSPEKLSHPTKSRKMFLSMMSVEFKDRRKIYDQILSVLAGGGNWTGRDKTRLSLSANIKTVQG